ncbi:hypothetical protein SEA_TIMINATOR_69 [Arthrobacter phage Timinator]|uniref:Uncharacterized protein n=2 Tax=Marthavirus barretlemon TaxID=2560300 RepID=A0A386KMP9_9CAUD|nr:hypothetical protein SEA_TIMINATOR_69 [Arthrobacter phage Timinator]AYD86540.1 hypothetical protein SEA_LEEROYJ_69 [Arthrobacter phage LeeroyJ]
MLRSCPACTKRQAQLVDPKCPICQGRGVLQLGPAALAHNDAVVVSQAVAIALEAEARDIDLKLTRSDDRISPLRSTIRALQEAGVLDGFGISFPTTVHKAVDKSEDPEQLARQLTEVIIVDVDARLIDAPHCEYDIGDRPNAYGLPPLSANNHPSHLARVTDPAEVGGSTAEQVVTRAAQARRARVLVSAVPETLRIKQRNRKAQK